MAILTTISTAILKALSTGGLKITKQSLYEG